MLQKGPKYRNLQLLMNCQGIVELLEQYMFKKNKLVGSLCKELLHINKKKTNNCTESQAEDISRNFTAEEILTAMKYMKRCLTLLGLGN